jgi:hypothetical protein
MTIASTALRLRRSFANSAGTVVFGMEDGTVSIFGLILGAAAKDARPIVLHEFAARFPRPSDGAMKTCDFGKSSKTAAGLPK